MSPSPSDPVLTKVLIDLDNELLPILIRSGADKRILAGICAPSPTRKVIPPMVAPEPSERGRVETVTGARFEIVGSWHLLHELVEIAQHGRRGRGTLGVPQRPASRRRHGHACVGPSVDVGSGRTIGAAERTPVRLHVSKDTETRQTAGIGGATLPVGRRERVAGEVDRGPRGVGIGGGGGDCAVRVSWNPSLPESEDPIAGCIG